MPASVLVEISIALHIIFIPQIVSCLFCLFFLLLFCGSFLLQLLSHQMTSVAVLHPHDCLKNKLPNMKLPNPNPKPPRSNRTHPNRQRRSQNTTRPVSTSDSKPQDNKLVMGQVKILKRGEQLTKTTPDLELKTVEKELLLKERVDSLYAGSSSFPASPPPSSVPLPIFITKKIAAVSDATDDLRKILRLDFS